jgi:catechol 2,3-dioxygenase-like lactoylglutathione lyase family enzyme
MNINKSFPLTITPDIAKCRDFYAENFDFAVVFEADWYIHLRHPSGIELAFMKPGLENQPEILRTPYTGTGVVVSFETDDAAAEYDRLRTLGLEFVHPLTDEQWGQRHFMLADPSGMIVDVVQAIESNDGD